MIGYTGLVPRPRDGREVARTQRNVLRVHTVQGRPVVVLADFREELERRCAEECVNLEFRRDRVQLWRDIIRRTRVES